MGVMRLFLLPGMDGTGSLFEPFVRELPSWLVPTVIDYPTNVVLDSDALLDHVKAQFPQHEEPFAVVAESFSGPVAIRFAAKNPPGLTALILAASFIRSPVSQWLSIIAGAATPIFALPLPPTVIRRVLAGSDASDELVKQVGAAIASVEPRVMAERARQILKCDVTAEAARTHVPMLYVMGARDRLVRPRSEHALRAVRPDLTTMVFDSPHLVLQRKGAEAAGAVEKFIHSVR